MRFKQTKSIDPLKAKARKRKASQAPEIKTLMELQKQAFESMMESAEGKGAISKASAGLKGLQAAYNLQEEFKEARTGVQSRYGNIAKAFGLANSKQAEMLDKIFGKRLSKEEIDKRKEKFGIKEKEEEKAKKEQSEKSKKRDEQLKEIYDTTMEMSKILENIRLSVEGIANKLRASQAKQVPGSKRDMRKLEKQSGLKYSKESGRYRDVKTGKFVSDENARQRMNLSASAIKTATPTSKTTTATVAPAPSASKIDADLQSKTIGGVDIPEGPKEENNLKGLEQKVGKVQDTIDDILDMFSLKKFYRLIGGAVGALIPGIIAIGKFLFNVAQKGWAIVTDIASKVWENIKEFLVGIKLEIPEIMGPFTVDLPGMDPFTIGPIGGFTFQPFKFLGGTEKPESMPSVEAPSAAESKGPSTRGGPRRKAEPEPTPEATPSATPAPTGGGGGPAPAPASGGGAPPAPAPGAAVVDSSVPFTSSETRSETRNEGSEQVTITRQSSTTVGPATRQGSSMPGAAPPKEKKKADVGGAKQAAMDAAARYGITGSHLAQFMAQIDHESGHFKRLEENLNYSAKRLMEVFPKYYKDPALAAAEQGNPQLIANRVYGGRMGNGPPESGDGYKYRGRGLIQLTGKDNYTRFGKIVGMDLVANPDSAAELTTAANLAAAFYKKTVVDAGIQAEDTKRVTKAINGGSHGLSDRTNLFAMYQQQAPAGAPGAQPGGPVYAAAGGVASGPASGYPATLHGTEAIIPLDGQSHRSKQAVAAVSRAVSGEDIQNQSAENAAASKSPTVVPVPMTAGGAGGGGREQRKPDIQGSPVKAQPRMGDDVFNRAIAKDFSHPSTFTTVSLV